MSERFGKETWVIIQSSHLEWKVCLFGLSFTRGRLGQSCVLLLIQVEQINSLAQQFVTHNYLLHYSTLICWAIISIRVTCAGRAKYHSRQAESDIAVPAWCKSKEKLEVTLVWLRFIEKDIAGQKQGIFIERGNLSIYIILLKSEMLDIRGSRMVIPHFRLTEEQTYLGEKTVLPPF